jgi:uncharacterized membrane protein YphA (DoxX/SURF4 family)
VNSASSNLPLRYVLILIRCLLGGTFIYLGILKALQPIYFLKAVHEYDFIQNPYLLNSIVATLPWLEIFCGMLLVIGVAPRGTALVLLAMLLPFTALVLRRALAIGEAQGIPFCAVSFDCGCGTGVINICRKLIENTGLILLSIVVLIFSPAAIANFNSRLSASCVNKRSRLSIQE